MSRTDEAGNIRLNEAYANISPGEAARLTRRANQEQISSIAMTVEKPASISRGLLLPYLTLTNAPQAAASPAPTRT